jgi:hypothetical protein
MVSRVNEQGFEQSIHRVDSSWAHPKTTDLTQDRGESINDRMCEGGGASSTHAKLSFPTVQPTAHITIKMTIAYVKNHANQTMNEIYGKSTKHLGEE